jgi:hypothetical protein
MLITQRIPTRDHPRIAAVIFLFTLTAFGVAADDLTRPIAASGAGHFLITADGKPFFWLGDTAWELFHRLDREETEMYLQDRARKGFNVIQVVATGKLDYEGLKAPSRSGETPFIDADPARPNPRYFAHIDWVVDRAAHYGIRMAILPIWNTFLIKSGPSRAFDMARAEQYGRWIAQRYRRKGVIWVLGGDMNPILATAARGPGDRSHGYISTVDFRPVFDAMASGIVTGEGGNPFITYHPSCCSPSAAARPRMSLYFGDRDWFDMSMLQSSHHAHPNSVDAEGGGYADGMNFGETEGSGFVWNGLYNYLPVFDEYRAVPARPVLDSEPRYEDHPIFINFKFESSGLWRAHDVRGALYQALFAGAAGHTYGHFSVWDFYDPRQAGRAAPGYIDEAYGDVMRHRSPWQQALNAPAAGQMQHGKALLLSRPYFSRIPDQSLIIGAQGEGEQHIGATRDREGSYAMIYLPQGQSVTVDLGKISGTAVFGWWFDPRSGTATRIEGSFATNQAHRFVPPTNGPDQDWVLVIDDASKNYSAPGSVRS